METYDLIKKRNTDLLITKILKPSVLGERKCQGFFALPNVGHLWWFFFVYVVLYNVILFSHFV